MELVKILNPKCNNSNKKNEKYLKNYMRKK